MAHRTSAAALHTARVILKEYDLSVRPPEVLVSGRVYNLEASEAHLGIVIDHATNIHHVALLRPEIRYYQKHLQTGTTTAPQIAGLFRRILDAFELIPRDPESMESVKITSAYELPGEFGVTKPEVYVLEKPAREVARFVFHYYEVSPRGRTLDDVLDRHRVAKLAEASLGISRAQRILPLLRKTDTQLREGKASQADVVKCLRTVGIYLEYIPGYEERDEETKLLH